MAIVADSDGSMAGFQPTSVVLTHNVAVGAGGRIVGEIRITFRIDERVATDSNREPDSNTKDYSGKRLTEHRPIAPL